MATLPKNLTLAKTPAYGDAGVPVPPPPGPVAGLDVDLANTFVLGVTRIPGSSPATNCHTNIRLSDLINYIVDTAKGQ